MRLTRLSMMGVVVVAMIVSAACREHETITGSYGQGVVTGEVVMAAGTSASPEGVRVEVVGTGMSTLLGRDGRFTFAGVPENADLRFTRGDGIDARVNVSSSGRGALVVQIEGNTAKAGRRRAAPSVPLLKVEGVVDSATATSVVVTPAQGAKVTLKITDATIIHSGDKKIAATDLKQGDKVEVKAITKDGDTIALEIDVQNENDGNDDHHDDAVAIGVVKSVGTNQLVLTTASGDVTVQTDSNTKIKKQGVTITLADIKVGDKAAAHGTKVDAHTLKASEIEVESTDDHHGEGAFAAGVVKSVGTNQLVLTTAAGDVTVLTDSKTVIEKDDHPATLADIKVGDKAAAHGTAVDAHTLKASEIEVESGDDHHDANQVFVAGVVKSVGTSSLVVTTPKGDVTLQVDSTTTIKKDDSSIALAAIHAGDLVAARGTRVDDHTVKAAQIEVEEAGGHK